MMRQVLVTGSTGFLGRIVTADLRARGMRVRTAGRRDSDVVVPSVDAGSDWRAALVGASHVVHLAARAHVLEENAADPLAAFRAVNTAGTLALARQAAEAGVERLVFVSSLKVNGEGRDEPYTEADPPDPHGPYALSKAEAEQGLQAIARDTGMAVTIIRPPLVYGPGVKANFLRLIQLVDRGIPLPFGRVSNRRSFIYAGNLGSAIHTCLSHPAAANRTFLVADGEAISTPALIEDIAKALGKPARLLPIPPNMLRWGLAAIGKQAAAERLLGSLYLDPQTIQRDLQWSPPFSRAEGLAETIAGYQRINA